MTFYDALATYKPSDGQAEISASTQPWTKRLGDGVPQAVDTHLRRNEWFGWCGTRRKSSMVSTLAETNCKACLTFVEMYRRKVAGETDD